MIYANEELESTDILYDPTVWKNKICNGES